jgi:hypothetical protein
MEQEQPRRTRRASAVDVRNSIQSRRSLLIPAKMAEMFKKSLTDVNDQNPISPDEAQQVLQSIEALPSAVSQAVETNHFGSNAVFRQSVYYTCAFYVTFTFATVNRLVQEFTGKTYFPIILLHCIFIPLQGFFNGTCTFHFEQD